MAEISIKEKLHLAIAEIEDEKLLKSLYNILNYAERRDFEIPDEHLNILNERRAKYLSGEE
jgi:hypothetical protein